eukprot:15469551-Alexandrium_andersonii.AAC.1
MMVANARFIIQSDRFGHSGNNGKQNPGTYRRFVARMGRRGMYAAVRPTLATEASGCAHLRA